MNLELEIKRLVNNMKQVHFLNSFFFFFCESKTVKMCFLSHYNYCIVFTTVVIVLTVQAIIQSCEKKSTLFQV